MKRYKLLNSEYYPNFTKNKIYDEDYRDSLVGNSIKEYVLLFPKDWEEVKDEDQLKIDYDFINPKHYKNYSIEVIDMMIRIYGKEQTAIYCEMNAFKYRMRAGTKPDQPIERDYDKEKWYLNKAKELRKI